MITFTAGGDSQTDYNAGYGVRPHRTWAPVVAELLKAKGVSAQSRAFGVSGDTSQQLLDRADVLLQYGVPDVGGIAIGVNDPGASISQATTQANIQALIKVLKHGVAGPGAGLGGPVYVSSQTNLPAEAKAGQRYIVLSDTSTTGGVAGWNESHAATITGTSAGQTVWEYRYPLAGEYGWGRVATASTPATVCKKIVVVSPPYLNFSTGGDTLTTPYAAYTNIRAAQQAAVAAENQSIAGAASVLYADVYTLMRNRIVAGTDPDFSAVAYNQARSWHYTQNNQHFSAYGHALVAQAVLAALPAAWISALT